MGKNKKENVMEQTKDKPSQSNEPKLEPKERIDAGKDSKKIPAAALNISEPQKEIKEPPRIRAARPEELAKHHFNKLTDMGQEFVDVSINRYEIANEMMRTWWDMMGQIYLAFNPFK